LGYNTFTHGKVTAKPCIAILFKQKCLFSKMENRQVKQVLCRGLGTSGRGGHKERVKEGECGGILCSHV
jgi:hypothetical protein